MPEDLKKNSQKGKHDAKEQRKPRQSRHAAGKPEQKVDKKVDEPKVPVQTKPVYEDPGPEFYKNLRRETDEILKITEEANSKYKKKEIQSNWTKYEMPVESYDEIEEQENLGADYEKLINASVSVGGHFQFKHEKSWDTDTGPSLYDKYFDINVDDLATALSTIPFYERNNIDKSIFSETDVLNMEARSVKYKRKYYNDKSFKTAELEAQDTILEKLVGNKDKEDSILEDGNLKSSNAKSSKDVGKSDVSFETRNETDIVKNLTEENNENKELTEQIDVCSSNKKGPAKSNDKDVDDIDDLILGIPKTETTVISVTKVEIPECGSTHKKIAPKVAEDSPSGTKPKTETPEDLEKWLDDFLDG